MAKSYNIYERDWVLIPFDTRSKIVELFSIPRTGTTYCIDNDIVSDGYTDDDLVSITIERLQEILKSKSSDFDELFDEMVDIINNKKQLPYEQVKGTDKGGNETPTASKNSKTKNK